MKITIIFPDGTEKIIVCKAALVKKDTNTLDIFHENSDIEYFNWDKIRSVRFGYGQELRNDTNKIATT